MNYTVAWDNMEQQWIVLCEDCDAEWTVPQPWDIATIIEDHVAEHQDE